MKYLLIIFLFLSVVGDGLKKASRINDAVQEAGEKYRRGQFQQAYDIYRYLEDSLGVSDEELILNRAHAAFRSGQISLATKDYLRLAKKADPTLQSKASTQLGLIYFEQENPERALYTFKKAIIQNPLNDTARYNYELVKKYLAANPAAAFRARTPNQKRRPEPGQQGRQDSPTNGTKPAEEGQAGTAPDFSQTGSNPPVNKPERDGNGQNPASGQGPQPQPGSNRQQQENARGSAGTNQRGLSNDLQDGGGAGPNRQPGGTESISAHEKQMQTLRARLRKGDLSPEKAQQLLEAMRQAELQYLQQLPRPRAKKPKKGQPDW